MANAKLNNKVFGAASKKAAGKEKVVATFDVGDEHFEIKEANDTRMAYLIHDMSEGDGAKTISSALNYVGNAVVGDDAHDRLKKAVFAAGLELEEVMEIFQYVLEAQSDETPTGPASASSARRPRTSTASQAKQS